MAQDLKLFPLDESCESILRATGIIQPATVLSFKKNFNSIFNQLRENTTPALRPRTLPEGTQISIFEDEGENLYDGDMFGPLTFLYAQDLKSLKVGDDPFHRAIAAFISTLPEDTRIVLYWH